MGKSRYQEDDVSLTTRSVSTTVFDFNVWKDDVDVINRTRNKLEVEFIKGEPTARALDRRDDTVLFRIKVVEDTWMLFRIDASRLFEIANFVLDEQARVAPNKGAEPQRD